MLLVALLAGGNWTNSTNCGSRSRNANNARSNTDANNGRRRRIRRKGEATPAESVTLSQGKIRKGEGFLLVVTAKARNFILSMRRYGNLWERVIDRENVFRAYRKARRGKSALHGVQSFERNVERNIDRAVQMLKDKTFHTSRYSEKIIYEPKKRTIYILPFFPDRVIQHAVMNIVAPVWDRLMIANSFACREGKGLHLGSRLTMQFVRHNKYCLKMDIRSFYPSIRHDILKSIIRRKIKDKNILWLLDDIIDSFPGNTNVPIGNLTSQWFGNLYMNELDTFVKHELKCRDYIRYCDDFCLFSNDKSYLRDCAEKIENYLKDHLALTLSKNDLFPVARGVDFLGFRHFPKYILLRKRTAKYLRRRIAHFYKQMQSGNLDKEHCRAVLSSANGSLKHANSHNFIEATHFMEVYDYARI